MQMHLKQTRNGNKTKYTLEWELEHHSGVPFQLAEVELSKALQGAGLHAIEALLANYDTCGEPLINGGVAWTSKGKKSRVIETKFGAVHLQRHVYQTSAGGATRAPLDERLGLISSATPELARMLASKCAELAAPIVQRDMAENHHRSMAASFIQDTAMRVSLAAEESATAAQWEPLLKEQLAQHAKEEQQKRDKKEVALGLAQQGQQQSMPKENQQKAGRCPALIVVGVDGAMLHSRQKAWRQAQAGTFSFYDSQGKHIDTLYVGCGPGETPSEGKIVFFDEMKKTLQRLKKLYPKAIVLGLSDAASDFREWLMENTSDWLADYHHAAEYLSGASASFDRWTNGAGLSGSKAWAAGMRSVLKMKTGGAAEILSAMQNEKLMAEARTDLPASVLEGLDRAITYFTNHHEHMDYSHWMWLKRPIGSGPTEAACKSIIKARMTQSGMRWSMLSAHAIIWLRALHRSPARWAAYWEYHQQSIVATAM
jgi:hypothetical protein